jgi:hypothetical protein
LPGADVADEANVVECRVCWSGPRGKFRIDVRNFRTHQVSRSGYAGVPSPIRRYTGCNEKPRMAIRDIPRAEWPAFLERFSREHRAWLATIHGVERRTPVTCVPSEAITALALEGNGPERTVRLTFRNGISLCALRPCTVRVQQTDDGSISALEIEAFDDVFVRVAFRVTARPEQLDGVAPGELTAATSFSD